MSDTRLILARIQLKEARAELDRLRRERDRVQSHLRAIKFAADAAADAGGYANIVTRRAVARMVEELWRDPDTKEQGDG